jgi:anthranilate/para-aminobenzoate synthase component II
MRRAVIFDYNSRFCADIVKTIVRYNSKFSDSGFSIDVYNFAELASESLAGPADVIIHSGGDGEPVVEDAAGAPRLYICHSHQWKAKKSGGELVRLDGYVSGIKEIEVLEDDELLGKKGGMAIMKYHSLAVTRPPREAKVLAKSRATREDGQKIEIIEALRYPDGSLSVQGHPEEGCGYHIFENFFQKMVLETVIK